MALVCANSSAFLMAPFMPSAPGVRTSSAPRAFSRFLRSTLMVSGMVKINLYPRDAATKARPTPVFPLVGSIMSVPGLIFPSASAASIIANAILSLTLPNGLKYSSFATIGDASPASLLYRFNANNGVFPIRSVSFCAILLIQSPSCLQLAEVNKGSKNPSLSKCPLSLQLF